MRAGGALEVGTQGAGLCMADRAQDSLGTGYIRRICLGHPNDGGALLRRPQLVITKPDLLDVATAGNQSELMLRKITKLNEVIILSGERPKRQN